MNSRKYVKTGIAALLLLASGAALADQQHVDYARVVSVTPEYERINAPSQECYDEQVTGRPDNRSYERSYGGSVIGGITGAIVGNQIGRGHGKEAATAFGAITGAIVGDRLQNQNDDQWGPRTVRRCRSVDRWENRIAGYRVVYEYAGRRYSDLMQNDPGSKLRVKVSVDPYEY